MSVLKKLGSVFAAPVLAASVFFAPYHADAMEIQQFDQMSLDDRGNYVQALVGGSINFLILNSKFEEGDQFQKLFKRKPSGEISDGMKEFIRVLEEVREIERRGMTKKALHVEHAFAIVLKRHGIAISMGDMMQFAKDFKPQDDRIAGDVTPSPKL